MKSISPSRFVIPLVLFAACAVAAPGEDKITYADHIRPILSQHCFNCHNADQSKAGLNLTNFNAILSGGSSGEVVSPGDVSSSRLYALVSHAEQPTMPPNASRIPDAQLAQIKAWIEGGCLDTASSRPRKATAPNVDLALSSVPIGRPEGPPIMPDTMPLGPVVSTSKPDAIVALAAAPWAPLIALGGQKQVLIYDTQHAELLGVLPFDDFPKRVGFSRSGQLLFAAGGRGAASGYAKLWSVQTGELVAEVGEEYDAILAADLNPDQTRVAVGGPNRKVKVYSTSNELIARIDKHTDWVLALAYSPDGILLATADRNGNLFIWEAETLAPMYTLEGHPSAITAVAWRDDSNVLASAGEDGTIRLWEMHRGKKIKQWNAHNDGVLSVRFSHDGQLVSTGRDRRAVVWQQDSNAVREIKGFSDITTTAAFDHADEKLIVGDWTGRVQVFDAKEGSALGELSAAPPTVEVRLAEAQQGRSQANERLTLLTTEAQNKTSVSEQAATQHVEQERQLKEAQAALQGIEQQTQTLQQSRDQKRTQLEELRQTVAAGETAVAQVDQTITELEQRATDLRQKINELQPQIESATTTLDERRRVAQQADEAAKQSPDDATLAEAAGVAQQSVAEAETQLATLQTNASALATEIESLSKPLTDAAAAQETARQQLKEHRQQLAALQQALEALTQEIATAEQNLKTAQQKVATVAATKQTAQEAAAAAKAQATAADKQVQQATIVLAEADRRLAKWGWAQLGVRIDGEEAKQFSLTKQISPLGEAAELAAAAAKDATTRLATLEGELAELPTLLDRRVAAIGESETVAMAANAAIGPKQTTLTAGEQLLTDYTAAVAMLRQGGDGNEAPKLQQAIAQAEAALGLIEQHRDAAAKSLENAKLDAEDAAFDLEVVRDAVVQAKERQQSLPTEIEALRAEVAAATMKAEQAQQQYALASVPLDELKAQIEKMRQEHAVLHAASLRQ